MGNLHGDPQRSEIELETIFTVSAGAFSPVAAIGTFAAIVALTVNIVSSSISSR